MLQALEELAMNYDQKSQEVEAKVTECEGLTEDVQRKAVSENSGDDTNDTLIDFIYCHY